MHAWRDGTDWHTEIVDPDMSGRGPETSEGIGQALYVGFSNLAIAVDGRGRIHISYRAYQTEGNFVNMEKGA